MQGEPRSRQDSTWDSEPGGIRCPAFVFAFFVELSLPLAIPLPITDFSLSAFEERPSPMLPKCKDRGKSAFRRMIASPAKPAASSVVLVDVCPMVVAIGCDALVRAWRHLTRMV